MELFVIRHAIAEDGDDDDARPLSKEGARRFREVVRLLRRLDVSLERVLHSPKLRASQTAELLNAIVDGPFEVTSLLAQPPAPALLGLFQGGSVGVVGHEPHLSALVSWLIAGGPTGAAIELKKGAVAHLRGEPRPGGMRLLALLPPKIARR